MDPKRLFDTIDTQLFESWVAERRQEDLHLDFKLVAGVGDLGKDDKRNLAKAVGGFANSDGGLIIWGIDSRKDSNGVDAATELRPILNPAAILSRLQSLTGQAASPIVDGVLHRLVPAPDDRGFLVTYVPVSDAGPHMAMLGEGRYYKRSGDSFYRMEHFDVADMFGRRAVPDLRVSVEAAIGSVYHTNPVRVSLDPVLKIENRGRGVAKFPMLRVKVSSPYSYSPYELGSKKTGLAVRAQAGSSEWRVFAGGANDVIHPGTVLQITQLHLDVLGNAEDLVDLVVEFEVACEGMRPVSDRCVRSGKDLLAYVKDEIGRKVPQPPPS